MNRVKALTYTGGLWLCLLSCVLPAEAVAPSAPAVIQAVRASVNRDVTSVAILLHGRAASGLHDEGNRLVVTLQNAAPASDLAGHLQSGGLVSGIGLESEPGSAATRITLVLRTPSEGRLMPSPDGQTLRVAIAPPGRLPRISRPAPVKPAVARPVAPTVPQRSLAPVLAPASATVSIPVREAVQTRPLPVPSVPAPVRTILRAPDYRRLYNVNAYQSDLAGVLNSLAQDARVSIVMAGPVAGKVTLNLHEVPLVKAIDLLTKAAGLAYHQDGDTFVIGGAKDIEAAYPKPGPEMTQTVYQCLHIRAADLVTSLQAMFDKDQLRVSVGAASYSPRLDQSTNEAATRIAGTALKTDSGGGSMAEPGLASHAVILAGASDIVSQALDLAHKLDAQRPQVKISVRITDVSLNALKDLGLQWNFGSVSLTESAPHGISFGSFARSPLSIDATISALEQNNRAKLLAAPTLSMLDGEHGYILIGDRLLYPTLIGYTQAQTPIFDKAEERVGIYLQVAAQVGADGEVTLSLYPQVSVVTDYLKVNGASYPQISTREQQTTVRVRDGQNIVVGGLIRDEEIENIQRVPGLSRIPFFGQLFTNRQKTRQRSEVVIVITPEIIKD